MAIKAKENLIIWRMKRAGLVRLPTFRKGRTRGKLQSTFRFYGQLNDFLPKRYRHKDLPFAYLGSPTVGETIERIGPPHPEIALIVLNGKQARWGARLLGNERIAVFPKLQWQEANPLLPAYQGEPRFVLDVHLGKLARFLRLLGFDSMFRPDFSDPEIAGISVSQNRIVLTRDIALLKRKVIVHGYFPRTINPKSQLLEIVGQFDMAKFARPFTLCLDCNGTLIETGKADVAGDIPAYIHQRYDKFARCSQCAKVFWEGGHYKDMKRFIAGILEQ